MGSFSLKLGEVERIAKSFAQKAPIIHNALDRKVNLMTDIVYRTARARRPKISKSEQAALGRSTAKGTYRVSDPNAVLGVPVDTGALQNSIEKKVYWKGEKIIGEITAGKGIPYANMIEYGTSRMKARPFMRPAMNLNRDTLIKIFKSPIINL